MGMEATTDLRRYLDRGIRGLIKSAAASALHNPRESLYLAGFAASAARAQRRRARLAGRGEPVPPFLIASVTNRCNLSCAGCYARANHVCGEEPARGQPLTLTAGEWESIFSQAEALGVSFILLAGGEPLMRREILLRAAEHPGTLFPVFSNGTLLDEAWAEWFDAKRNLLPVLSVEGGAASTDARRGAGVAASLEAAMERLSRRGVFWGSSVTVTGQNLVEVTGGAFLSRLRQKGCRVVFFVEYVPADPAAQERALTPEEREILNRRVEELRRAGGEMLLLSFPGDEMASGGCLAAGRGFFHINPLGGAEPCPFSPHSDVNLKTSTLRQALRSPLFWALRGGGLLGQEHSGGCALAGRQREVAALCGKTLPAEPAST